MSDSQILTFLKETTQENPKPTLEISRAVNGEKATKKMVNPALYRLQRAGHLEKVANENGGKPRWYITDSGRALTE